MRQFDFPQACISALIRPLPPPPGHHGPSHSLHLVLGHQHHLKQQHELQRRPVGGRPAGGGTFRQLGLHRALAGGADLWPSPYAGCGQGHAVPMTSPSPPSWIDTYCCL